MKKNLWKKKPKNYFGLLLIYAGLLFACTALLYVQERIQSFAVTDFSANSVHKFTTYHMSNHIRGITIWMTGEIDGEVRISYPYWDESYTIKAGPIDYLYSRDTYTNQALLMIDPQGAPVGRLNVYYQFHTFYSELFPEWTVNLFNKGEGLYYDR